MNNDVTYKNVKIDVIDGENVVSFTSVDKNGKESNETIPCFNADGTENIIALDILTAARKQEYVSKMMENYKAYLNKTAEETAAIVDEIHKNVMDETSENNDEFEEKFNNNDTATPVTETNQDEASNNELIEAKASANSNWFKKHAGTTLKVVGAGLIGLALAQQIGTGLLGYAAGLNIGKNSKDESNSSSISTEAIADEQTEAEKMVEGAVQYISYDDAVTDMASIGKEWQKLGYTSVSQRSLNSLYFITNYRMFEEDTIKQMVDNNVVSSDPMVIIGDSLEALSVCNDQGSKYLTGQDKNLIDMTMFCVDKEDKELVNYAYNSLQQMGTNATDEQAQQQFENYYHYLCNEEDETSYPIIYNEASKGGNFLLNQSYGPIYAVAGGQHSVSQSELDYIERNTGMNDFSSVIKEMQNCLNNANTNDVDSELQNNSSRSLN